ncbi:outer membrane protein assembly factor BamD [Bacteroidetes/Chlorobi group bacterium Naka2016]|jgi:TolA-binding protein|nr:MAG: outer membrane protein assembly factor BamD [Bacteroidetes/Chlorobi group bacterium Naka2016]
MKIAKLTKIIFLFLLLPCVFSTIFSQTIFDEKFKLALSFEKSGDFAKAEEIYSEIYQQNKSRLDFFFGLVRCKKALNKFSELIPIVDEQLKINKSLDLYLIAGEVYWVTGNSEKSKEYWNLAIKTYPKNDSTYIKLANLQSNLRLFDLAIGTLLDGRKNLGNESLFSDDLIKLFLITKNYEKGIDEILKQFEKNNDFNWVQAKITLFIDNKDTRTILENRLKKGKSGFNLQYKYLLAWFYYSIKDWEKALSAYKEYDEQTKSNGYEVYRFGYTALKDGEYDVAIKAFEYVISLGRKSEYLTNSIYGIAKASDLKLLNGGKVQSNLVQNVVKRYEDVLKDVSKNSALYFEINYRIAYLKAVYLGDFQNSEKILLEMISNRYNPMNLKAKLLLGDVYLYQNRFTQAETRYREIFNSSKVGKPEEYYLAIQKLGKIKYYQAQFDSAQYYYSLLIEEAPGEIANDALEKSFLIEKFKQYNLALSFLATAELKQEMNNLDSAIFYLNQAIQKTEGTDFGEYLTLKKIKLYADAGLFELSENEAKDFLNKFQKSIYFDEVLYLLGFSQFNQNKTLESISTFTELITKYPRSIFTPKARAIINKLRKES